MRINKINDRILNEVCYMSINNLTDENMINEYLECKSVQKKISILKNILIKNKINNDKRETIIYEYLYELVPPGTKGVLRGNKFNDIVKNVIVEMKINDNKFNVFFEKKCPIIETDEIPDWYIIDIKTNRVLIGMNQLDLWKGGHQLNRGSKYLLNKKTNTKNSKILCVVCNKIQFNSEKSKAFKLFEVGFANDTICYIKNLPNIITCFFGEIN